MDRPGGSQARLDGSQRFPLKVGEAIGPKVLKHQTLQTYCPTYCRQAASLLPSWRLWCLAKWGSFRSRRKLSRTECTMTNGIFEGLESLEVVGVALLLSLSILSCGSDAAGPTPVANNPHSLGNRTVLSRRSGRRSN